MKLDQSVVSRYINRDGVCQCKSCKKDLDVGDEAHPHVGCLKTVLYCQECAEEKCIV